MRSIIPTVAIGCAAIALGCGRVSFEADGGASPDSQGGEGGEATLDSSVDGRDGNDGSADASTGDGAVACGPIEVFAGINEGARSGVAHFSYDPSAAAGEALDLLNDWTIEQVGFQGVSSSALRSIATMPSGRILIADVSAPRLVMLDPHSGERDVVIINDVDPGAVRRVHAACARNNQSLIVGEFVSTTSPGAVIVEYDGSGQLIRPVASTAFSGGAMTECWSASGGSTVYYVDSETSGNGVASDFVRVDLVDGSWMERDRFRMAEFDGGRGTLIWSATVHEDGNAYIAPARWALSEGRVDRFIRCALDNIAASACEMIGPTLPVDDGQGWISGVASVPCTDHLVFATTSRIYRYRLGQDSIELLFDLGTKLPGLSDIRKVAARLRP